MSTIKIPGTATRIAFASSEPSLHRSPARWTELAVYHDETDPDRRPFYAASRGCSTFDGERLREEIIHVGTLERALKLFNLETNLGRSLFAQAEDWAANRAPASAPILNSDVERAIGESVFTERAPFDNQEEALRWLYGDELESATPATLISRDFGAGESTVRAALAAGRDVKIPLTAALRFFDKARFLAAREARNA